MFETSDNRRELVNVRLEDGQRDAANRRLVRGSRVRVHHHIRPRIAWVNWFSRSARPTPAAAPKPSHA